MAEVPPGPSSLLASPPGAAAALLSPFPGTAEEEEEEEEDEEKGGRRFCRREEEEEEAEEEGMREGSLPRRRVCQPHRHYHQLNGLIVGSDLRHLRSSLKDKVLSHSNENQCPPNSKKNSKATISTGPGKTMGHGQEPQHPCQGGERETSPSSLSNHHQVPCPQARTAQSQQQHHHHHHHHASAPSAGDRNGLVGGGELEEGEEDQELEREEESLLLLSRSLASTCSLQKCSMGSHTDTSWPPQQVKEEKGDLTIRYVRYESELQMPDIMRLITKDLSEPYSIYTYRYFIHNWPQLCFLAMVGDECVGAIVCKLDMHKKMFRRGYIAMLAVDSKYRRKGIGTNLVKKAIYAMVEGDCDEVVLETEITNKSALKLYENLGFVRDKRLFRYYLNGVDALRLKLWLR
ncbi:PREDICTED: N-alpha-acetyltransferase 30 [Thamnophis sirtalis]|uniref:N-alpha-acetyltransferase 30 n=1 Tax=Thamnophis sirtalis TaxID=35019 RepID=A0A6I9XT01_9SAUR|nr:PREDICTED: N-alpha-acetyltransferase 30 [Thamnophis sirtalis]